MKNKKKNWMGIYKSCLVGYGAIFGFFLVYFAQSLIHLINRYLPNPHYRLLHLIYPEYYIIITFVIMCLIVHFGEKHIKKIEAKIF